MSAVETQPDPTKPHPSPPLKFAPPIPRLASDPIPNRKIRNSFEPQTDYRQNCKLPISPMTQIQPGLTKLKPRPQENNNTCKNPQQQTNGTQRNGTGTFLSIWACAPPLKFCPIWLDSARVRLLCGLSYACPPVECPSGRQSVQYYSDARQVLYWVL